MYQNEKPLVRSPVGNNQWKTDTQTNTPSMNITAVQIWPKLIVIHVSNFKSHWLKAQLLTISGKHTHTCTCMNTHTHIHAGTHTYTRMQVHTHTHACRYKHTHTHTMLKMWIELNRINGFGKACRFSQLDLAPVQRSRGQLHRLNIKIHWATPHRPVKT